MMDRRDFLKNTALVSAACLMDFRETLAWGAEDAEIGRTWKGWKEGQFQIHLIYTRVSESMFLIFPNDTAMLLDCGDHNTIRCGRLTVPVLPDPDRYAGEWISRYVRRVNPQRNYVDYMMLAHYHLDHGGNNKFYVRKETRDGEDCYLSGFSQAAKYLTFSKAFDRCWPDYNDPLSLTQKTADASEHVKDFYDYMLAHKKVGVEKFCLGEANQITTKKDATAYPGFSVENICANGRIADKEGNMCDLCAECKKSNPVKFSENGVSLDIVFTCGDFKFYMAGSFSDDWELPSGKRSKIEGAIADMVESVNVAKISHHGHMSMADRLVATLRPRVVVNNVWDQLRTLPSVMRRFYSRDPYPGERIVCPTVFPAERRAEDVGQPWLDIPNPSSFDVDHMIVDVEEGGKDYSVTHLTANDKSMTVEGAMRFKS